jgi:hypothetical protein
MGATLAPRIVMTLIFSFFARQKTFVARDSRQKFYAGALLGGHRRKGLPAALTDYATSSVPRGSSKETLAKQCP